MYRACKIYHYGLDSDKSFKGWHEFYMAGNAIN